jgi:hypothetical protein
VEIELHSSRYSENLYNRVSILGCGHVRWNLGCKRIFTLMVNTEPAKVRAVYERLSLELMFMHATKKNDTNVNGAFLRDTVELRIDL